MTNSFSFVITSFYILSFALTVALKKCSLNIIFYMILFTLYILRHISNFYFTLIVFSCTIFVFYNFFYLRPTMFGIFLGGLTAIYFRLEITLLEIGNLSFHKDQFPVPKNSKQLVLYRMQALPTKISAAIPLMKHLSTSQLTINLLLIHITRRNVFQIFNNILRVNTTTTTSFSCNIQKGPLLNPLSMLLGILKSLTQSLGDSCFFVFFMNHRCLYD